MKKGIKILIFVVILIGFLVWGYKHYFSQGVFGYNNLKKIEQEEIIDEKKALTETNLGILVKIPEGWEYKTANNGFTIKDPETNVENPLTDFREWTQGCSIEMSIEQDSIFEDEVERLSNLKMGNDKFSECDFFSFLYLNGREALIESKDFEETNFEGDIRIYYITILDKEKRIIYKINSLMSTQVPQCEEYFNQFVNNLKI